MQLAIPGESAAAKKDKLELLDMAGYHGYVTCFYDRVLFLVS